MKTYLKPTTIIVSLNNESFLTGSSNSTISTPVDKGPQTGISGARGWSGWSDADDDANYHFSNK